MRPLKSVTLLLSMTLLLPLQVFSNNYATRDDVLAFVDEMSEAEGFSRQALLQVFAEARYKQNVIDAISRPAEKVLSWKEYQDIFLTDRRIVQGRAFMEENAAALARAETEFGVPPAIVAAIIGVETMYGRRRGNFRVIDALSTLAFDYPPRGRFFRNELKEFLLLTREEKTSPVEPLGSYAGAMGYGQFIPSSYRHYAVDFDGDGLRDIWENRADAIGSVANYLARHGWRRGEPVMMPVDPPAETEDVSVFSSALEPSMSLRELESAGIVEGIDAPGDAEVAPLRFEGKDGSEFWLGFRNFYVITRYNHSKLYAMAVFQLSDYLRSGNLVGQ